VVFDHPDAAPMATILPLPVVLGRPLQKPDGFLGDYARMGCVSLKLPSSARELTPDEAELVEFARACIDASPDADGTHTMGAAVRAADGRTFVGVNLYHFTGGPCAELVALGTARAHGAHTVTHIVAVGNHGRGPVGPCGRDRQILLDYYPGIRVILPTAAGVRSVLIEDLLPLATGWSIATGSQTSG